MAQANVSMPLEPLINLARRQADTPGNGKENSGGVFSDKEFARTIGVAARTVARWRHAGNRLPWPAADLAATALSEHPVRIWGDEWLALDRDFLEGRAPSRVYVEVDEAMARIGEVLAEEAAREHAAA